MRHEVLISPDRKLETREDVGMVFLGRSAESEALLMALDEHRLVTVVGTGGVGKTTLALHVLEHRPDNRTPGSLVDLTELSPSGLIEGIAGSLGFGSFNSLVAAIGSDDWLLVLDNCEHILDPSGDAVETLMQRCPNLRVICTSREPLEVPDEVILRLEPLSTEGSPSPAAQLLVSASKARGHDISEDLKAVEDICKVLDGLPLAIELAAAKTGVMTPKEILRELDKPMEFLELRRSRRPDRHLSLRAAIQWSYDLLPAQDRQALERLSVFDGSFSSNLAMAAIGANDSGLIEGLVERSLLVRNSYAGESWFQMMGTIRAFALNQLRHNKELESTWERVVDTVIDDLIDIGVRPDRVPQILRYGFATVRRALETLLERDTQPTRMFEAMASLWWLEDIGHQSEGRNIARRVLEKWPDPTPESANVYGVLGALYASAADVERAREAASIAAQVGVGVGAAMGYRTLGQLKRREGLWDGALEHLRLGAAAARDAGEEGFALEIDLHAGLTVAKSGDVQSAIHILEAVVRGAERHLACLQWSRVFLSWLLLGNDSPRSVELAEASLQANDKIQDQWVRASGYQHLGIAAALEGGDATAAKHLATSLEAYATTRNRNDITLSLIAASTLLNRLGSDEQARGVMAAAGQYSGIDGLGKFEIDLFERIGPLPRAERADRALDIGQVISILETIGKGEVDTRSSASGAIPSFNQIGDLWEIAYRGSTAAMPASKGIADIATLVSRPGEEVSCLDLMGSRLAAGSFDVLSDDLALDKYKAKLVELQEELVEAEDHNDSYRADQIRAEMDRLIEHLNSVYGLSGKKRQEGDPAEKARSAVTARIRSAIKKMRDVNPDLAGHLDQSIKTGRFCIYDPPSPAEAKS